MTILAIDTSTTHGSVALLAEGELRLEETFTADRTTSSALLGLGTLLLAARRRRSAQA